MREEISDNEGDQAQKEPAIQCVGEETKKKWTESARDLRVSNKFKRKDMRSSFVFGICNIQFILRH